MKEKLLLQEFKGFFYADGTVSLHKRRNKNSYVKKDGTKSKEWHETYVVRIHIAQRIDNLPLLEEYKKEFGGLIYKQNSKNSNPAAYWSLQSIPACHKLLKHLLDTEFSYRGKDAVRAVYEYCDWKIKRGLQVKFKPEDHIKIQEWIDRVRKAHSFQVNK